MNFALEGAILTVSSGPMRNDQSGAAAMTDKYFQDLQSSEDRYGESLP